MPATEISVIVPVYNEARLARCLDGLFRQSLSRDRYEVLVVDNGPHEETRRLASGFPAEYLVAAGGGSYAARNRAVGRARGRILAFTDADCCAPPEWLSAIRAVFEDPACEVAVGPSSALNRDPIGLLVQMVDDERWARLRAEPVVTYCDTRNLAGRRELFEREPFDQTFAHGGDLEWGLRITAKGHRVRLVPEMSLAHENVSTVWAVRHRGIRRGRGVAVIRRRHGARVRISGSRPLTVLGIDVKETILRTATRSSVRPVASAGLAAATVGLAGLVATLQQVPGASGIARRAFQALDRTSLLLGHVRGA